MTERTAAFVEFELKGEFGASIECEACFPEFEGCSLAQVSFGHASAVFSGDGFRDRAIPLEFFRAQV